MALLVLFVTALLVALLQSTVLQGIALMGSQPDLVLLVLLFGAHRLGAQRGQVMGFLVGLFQDAIGLAPLGFHAVTRLVPSLLAGLLHGQVALDGIIVPVLTAAVAQFFKLVATALMSALVADVTVGIWGIANLIESLYTIGLAPVVFWLMRRLWRLFAFDQRKAV